MIEQTEAERQAIEKADAEKAAAEKRTAEADARFNAMLRRNHAPEPEPPSEDRQRVKAVLREGAEAGDKRARATLRAMEIEDGERKPPARADGGEGGGGSGQWDPFRPMTLTEQARQALLDKRYGKRHTENHKLPRGNR